MVLTRTYAVWFFLLQKQNEDAQGVLGAWRTMPQVEKYYRKRDSEPSDLRDS